MKYRCIFFDIDGTLLDTESVYQAALQKVLPALTGKHYEPEELRFAWGIPGLDTAARLKLPDPKRFMAEWAAEVERHAAAGPFPGIGPMLRQLCAAGYRLGIVTSKDREEFRRSFVPCGLPDCFEPALIVTADETARHKPDPAPLAEALRRAGIPPEQALYIGDTDYDSRCAAGAGVDFGLAVWGAGSVRHIKAAFYFAAPEEVAPRLDGDDPLAAMPWLGWATELQFIAQAGLTYCRDQFDLERFERIREIAGEIISAKSGLSLETVRDLFCSETGFQTPKLDTRAAIFRDGKILLVQERDGRWSLPGGWVDVNQSIRANTEKEVREEAGLTVAALRLIALQDRNRHNPPPYAYGICKVFVLCEVIAGAFEPNIETVCCGYFDEEALPPLAEEKNTAAQVRLCFEAARHPRWLPVFD